MVGGGTPLLQKFQRIISLLKERKISKIAILLHQNADADAIASAMGLKELINHFIPLTTIHLFASSLNSLTGNLCSTFNISVYNNLIVDEYKAFFFCDVNNLLQLGELVLNQDFPRDKLFFIIDHHSFHEFSEKADVTIIDQSFSSASEIISYIFYKSCISLPTDVATLLLAGIMSDSRRFLITSEHIFEVTNFLTKYGDYEKALSVLAIPISLSERIAKIKGMQRAILKKIDDDLIAISHVSSFESAVARSLTSVGADLAIVVSKQKSSNLRISLRCKKSFARKHNIDLGDIAYQLSLSLGGTGGGHITAAGINLPNLGNLPNDIDKLKHEVLKLILDKVY